MRIGIDCRLWDESGVGRYTRNLIKYLQVLDKTNEYVLFVLPKDEEQVKSEIINSKFKIIICDVRWHTIAEQFRLPLILQSERLDLVHFPYFSVPVFYPGKFVITIHDLILHHFQSGKASTHSSALYRLKLLGYKYVLARAVKRARKIITVSQSTKDDIVSIFKAEPDKVSVTYEGTDENLTKKLKFKSKKNKRLEIENLNAEEGKYFLYVGNAYPHKNLERLIDSFRKVQLEHSDLKLILVGKEDYFYEKLKEYIKKVKIEDSVIFTGFLEDKYVSQLYQRAIATVVPSFLEGFSLPSLEAMSNNCLVLASDIPITHEICKSAALYFDPLSTASMAKVLEDSLSSKYTEQKKIGLERSKNFSFEKMAKQTIELYTSATV